MNNDTHTEERRQWVRNQQKLHVEQAAEIKEKVLADLAGECINDPSLEWRFAELAEQYHQELFDKDHEEALRKNELWDTLQSILDDSDDTVDQAKYAIDKLRSNWIFRLFARE